MTTRHQDAAPSVWQKRRLRIAHENADRAARKLAQQRGRDDDREEDDDRPARSRGRQRRASGKPSAIITREQLKRQRSTIERVIALLVLLVSFIGSIATMHGGFAPMIATIVDHQYNQAAILSGIFIQALVTFLELHYFDIPLIAWGARVVDTATTAIGYGPLFLAQLMILLYNRGITEPTYAAWAIIGLASLAVAWFPETRLVD